MTMYQDEIMDHYRNPRNFGCRNCSSNTSSVMHNPSCGDKIIVHARVDDQTVRDICFEGFGCALSTASASLLTEHVKGMNVQNIHTITPEQVVEMLKISVSPARMKCALLPLEAIQEAVGSHQSTVVSKQ